MLGKYDPISHFQLIIISKEIVVSSMTNPFSEYICG